MLSPNSETVLGKEEQPKKYWKRKFEEFWKEYGEEFFIHNNVDVFLLIDYTLTEDVLLRQY